MCRGECPAPIHGIVFPRMEMWSILSGGRCGFVGAENVGSDGRYLGPTFPPSHFPLIPSLCTSLVEEPGINLKSSILELRIV